MAARLDLVLDERFALGRADRRDGRARERLECLWLLRLRCAKVCGR
jgi:hypothetical protein